MMIATQSYPPLIADLDRQLVQELASRLECDVALHTDIPSGCAAASTDARNGLTAAYVDWRHDPVTVALPLPTGKVAVWQVDSQDAQGTVNHALTILELQQSREEMHQLNAETEALATQVADDFEGLSLIQSLAASLELPSQRSGLPNSVLRFLRPLAEGVGACSVAAVLLDDDGDHMDEPVWSGEVLTSHRSLYALIQAHREEAQRHTVVRNDRKQSPTQVIATTLHEFMLVQCRSEGRLHGWLVACNRVDDQHKNAPWAQLGFSTVQASLLETAANQMAAQLHNMHLLRQREGLFTEMVRALVNAVEARDPYTCGHSERVALFAKCLASASGESSAVCERIYLTGLLHDVGKIAIPDDVLGKPGQLNDEERAIIETHPDAGWRMLHELEALRDVLPGVLYHHERYDGKGYPDGLAGEVIPMDGRILAVCDAFDAMTSDRPYRSGMSTANAAEILSDGAGKYWDPHLIDLFIENLDAIEAIRRQHRPRPQTIRRASADGRPAYQPDSNG
ncbi:MAG: HD-GYP domain-containing protein [Pirellulales bacterium]|nr:HD-GYP domain-containing protein [Pirellulales bacterium]